jgi:uncharacterized damage-inducible protein DinB
MSTREHFIERFRVERPRFVKVLKALPLDKLSYKPHERSQSAGAIAWFLVLELRALVDLLKSGENHWQQPAPESPEAILREYERAAEAMEQALASAGDAQWASPVRMYVGDRLVKEDALGDFLWDFFFDAIHHRGQLTTYIRPMGGKVPAVYGPSGDER